MMLGVVVWSKECTQAAVVWCDDHGDIAYLKGYGGLAEQPDYVSPDPAPPRWPAVGDLVTLQTATAGGVRLVRNLTILEADWGPALPAALRGAAQGAALPALQGAGNEHSPADPRPDPRPAWRPAPPAFPPGPFAPVAAQQGMMKPVQTPAETQAAPLPDAAGLGPALAEPRPDWRRSGTL